MFTNRRSGTISVFTALLFLVIWAVLYSSLDDKRPDVLSKYDYVSFLSKFTNNQKASKKCIDRCDQTFTDVFSALTTGYRTCLLETMKGKDASKWLRNAVKGCLGSALWKLLDVKVFENRDDKKQVILPPTNIPADGVFANCTEITLGIGRDIEAELLLRQAQPHCRFYGADPVKKSGSIFTELGPYFELAVAAEPGYIQTYVQTNYKNGYKQVNITAITMVDFLLNHVKVTNVDYAFIDNEGAEYGLMDKVIGQRVLEMNNISLCQIAMEVHLPFKYQHTDAKKYTAIIDRMLTNSSFVPIWSDTHTHIRTFYVNVEDPYCVGKYFRSKWCGNFRHYKAKKR